MSFMENLKTELDNELSITENGALGYVTSSSKLLDMNFKVTSYRCASIDSIVTDFHKAYAENHELAIKWLFYVRDVREGLGERRLFKIILNDLAKCESDKVKNIISYVPEYGRWDDLFTLLNTPCVKYAIDVIRDQLSEDSNNMKEGKPISLLAKWLPSENTSSKNTRKLAKYIRSGLNLNSEQYRKTLSELRKYIDVTERKMSAKEWNLIDYSKVPSNANLKYDKAFMRNDYDRRTDYLESLKKGKTKINASALYPHDIVHKYNNGRDHWFRQDDIEYNETYEQLWKNLPNPLNDAESTIVCMDGSGSMYSPVSGTSKVQAIDVSQALAIYYSERLSGDFKDKFISFGRYPQLIDLSNCDTLRSKIRLVQDYDDCGNTNIKAVFDTILNAAINNKLDQSELPNNIIVISDMEFDSAFSSHSTIDVLFEQIKKEYEEAGYKLPKLIFWNVCSRTNTIPLKQNEYGVVLVSGFSVNTIKMMLNNNLDPYKAMVDTLNVERYNKIAEIWNK